ncbi:MAG TPA: hypothetical protein VI732_07655 [Alphaproteobacteria bacterium]|jgi:hypothetical protein|nr:hypothetical protein [Alphaproteobacteria bacterium]
MIRRSMVVAVGLAAAVGAGLYQLKHEVMLLEQELAHVNRAILDDQEAIHVLKAEWTYLNEPRRLEALSKKYLELAPLAAAQVITIDDLPTRLDPVISDANNPTAAGGATQASTGAAR